MNVILDLMGNDYIISNPWGNAADGGTANGAGEFELVVISRGLMYIEIGDHTFWASGGLAIFCEDFQKNGNKFGKEAMDYFKEKGKTDAEIRNMEGIVGYCCDCRDGYVAKHITGRWDDPLDGKRGEIIACQPYAPDGKGGKTRKGPYGWTDPIFNTIWILEGW